MQHGTQVEKDTSLRDQEGSPDVVNVETEGDGQLSGVKLWSVVIGLGLAAFLMGMSGSIVATAVPRITNYFHSIADIGWYGSAYLLASCALQPLTGQIYTHFPSKYFFISFLAVFETGSVVCGASESSNMLVVGRAVAGAGGAGLLNGAITIIRAAVSKQQRPFIIGILSAVAATGSVSGPLIGGALTEERSWRWCCYINPFPGAFTALVLAFLPIPEQRKKTLTRSTLPPTLKKIDFTGFALFALAVIMCLLALEWGGYKYLWSFFTIIGLFCGAFGMSCVFWAWEYHKGETAMLSLKVFWRPVVCLGCSTLFFQFGTLVVLSYYLPIWFQVIKGANPEMSGVMTLPTLVSQALASVLAGKSVSKIGYYTPFALGGSMLASIGSGLMTTFVPSTSVGKWIGYQIMTGTGRGMVIQMPVTAINDLLSGDDVASAVAILVFCQYFGGALLLALGQTVFLARLGPALERFAPKIRAEDLINAGATNIRTVVPAAELNGVLFAYNRALTQTFVSLELMRAWRQ
jgi:MFS family permease